MLQYMTCHALHASTRCSRPAAADVSSSLSKLSTQPFRQALRKALHTRPSIQHGGASSAVARLFCRLACVS